MYRLTHTTHTQCTQRRIMFYVLVHTQAQTHQHSLIEYQVQREHQDVCMYFLPLTTVARDRSTGFAMSVALKN